MDTVGLVIEMKALVRFCEVTDNLALRERAKQRLIFLSEIPIENEYAMVVGDIKFKN